MGVWVGTLKVTAVPIVEDTTTLSWTAASLTARRDGHQTHRLARSARAGVDDNRIGNPRKLAGRPLVRVVRWAPRLQALGRETQHLTITPEKREAAPSL